MTLNYYIFSCLVIVQLEHDNNYQVINVYFNSFIFRIH